MPMSEEALRTSSTRPGLLQVVPPQLKDNAALKLALECLKMALERRDVELTRLMGEVIQKIMNPPTRVPVGTLEDPHPGADVEAPYVPHAWENANER